MTRPVALLTDAERFPFDTEDRARLAAASVELRELAGHDPDELVAAATGVDAIFVYHARFPRETIEQLNGVRVLARCGAGFDNIDVLAARERGIEVTYVPDYGADDVADHALALLLACAHRVAAGDRAIRAGDWPSYAELGTMFRLRGRTLGILGYGRIGRNLGGKGRALGLRVVAHDPYVETAGSTREEVLREADFLSLHIPLVPETHHYIGRPELAVMKPSAILINTARAGLVDTGRARRALRSGTIAGAGLDVFDKEPLRPDDPLRTLENVVLTPHSAVYTEESLAEVRKRALADTLRVLEGESPRNAVP